MITDRILIEQAIARGEPAERIIERYRLNGDQITPARLKNILAAMLDPEDDPSNQAQRLACPECNRPIRRDNMGRHLRDIHHDPKPVQQPKPTTTQAAEQHGTRRGWQQHREIYGTDPCGPCEIAETAYHAAQYKAQRRTTPRRGGLAALS